jgi:hypothetical protein
MKRKVPCEMAVWLREDETAYLDGRMRVKLARNEFVGAGRIIHHIQWLYRTADHGYRAAKAA